ncbi:hypothetical protein PybrP1_002213 [[Pythium] brassicae (nom. inval.)]|nr:hypothetical protein PybrP1_002213 [[Pythium] brassicae (nom. inval.)]
MSRISSSMSPTDALSSASRLLHARVGRELQRYDAGGARLLACVVALREAAEDADSEARVLLISSSKHPNVWILPKGGWESDETLAECALREAEEEAGVAGVLERELGTLDFATKHGKRCRIHGFQMTVHHEFDAWAESNRRREWVLISDALDRLCDRPELLAMLERAVSEFSWGVRA